MHKCNVHSWAEMLSNETERMDEACFKHSTWELNLGPDVASRITYPTQLLTTLATHQHEEALDHQDCTG